MYPPVEGCMGCTATALIHDRSWSWQLPSGRTRYPTVAKNETRADRKGGPCSHYAKPWPRIRANSAPPVLFRDPARARRAHDRSNFRCGWHIIRSIPCLLPGTLHPRTEHQDTLSRSWSERFGTSKVSMRYASTRKCDQCLIHNFCTVTSTTAHHCPRTILATSDRPRQITRTEYAPGAS